MKRPYFTQQQRQEIRDFPDTAYSAGLVLHLRLKQLISNIEKQALKAYVTCLKTKLF